MASWRPLTGEARKRTESSGDQLRSSVRPERVTRFSKTVSFPQRSSSSMPGRLHGCNGPRAATATLGSIVRPARFEKARPTRHAIAWRQDACPLECFKHSSLIRAGNDPVEIERCVRAALRKEANASCHRMASETLRNSNALGIRAPARGGGVFFGGFRRPSASRREVLHRCPAACMAATARDS
jgi:hypothetical protein